MRTLLILAFICICVRGHAQYNDSIQHYIGAAANGTINKTSTNTSYVFSNTVKFGMRKKSFALNSSNNWLFGEQNKKLTNNDVACAVDCNLYKTLPHFYYWGLATYTSSYSLKINNQYQAGLGVAYNLIDRKTLQLNISDGIIYEHSDINLKDTIRDVYSTYRNSLRVMVKCTLKEIFVINGTGFYQNSLSSATDYIVKTNVFAGIKLKKWLTLSATFSYNRFNRTQKENTLFTYGLAVDKYF